MVTAMDRLSPSAGRGPGELGQMMVGRDADEGAIAAQGLQPGEGEVARLGGAVLGDDGAGGDIGPALAFEKMRDGQARQIRCVRPRPPGRDRTRPGARAKGGRWNRRCGDCRSARGTPRPSAKRASEFRTLPMSWSLLPSQGFEQHRRTVPGLLRAQRRPRSGDRRSRRSAAARPCASSRARKPRSDWRAAALMTRL